MVTQDATSGSSAAPSRKYLVRTVAAALVAGVIAIMVSIVARKAAWPYPQSIALASFLFLIPILQPMAHDKGTGNWPSRLGLCVVFGLIGGFLHAFALNQ